MPDREKVIKAFEICDNNEDGIVCKKCPYKEDKWNGAWEDEEGKTCFQTLHSDALALLKEQEEHVKQWTKEIADNQLAHAPDELDRENWDYKKGIWDGLQIAWNIISEGR